MAELVEYLVGDSRIVEDLMTIRLPVLSKKRFNIINKWQPFRMLAKIIPLNIPSVARANGAWLVFHVVLMVDSAMVLCGWPLRPSTTGLLAPMLTRGGAAEHRCCVTCVQGG